MKDIDNLTESWICPHCNKDSGAYIIEDSVLKDDFKEILCGCLDCNELFIRQYKYEQTIKLTRE